MMSCLAQQSFDTNIFDVPYYRIVELNMSCLTAALPVLLQRKPIIIDAKIPSDDREFCRFLHQFGFRLVCTQIALSHDLVAISGAVIPAEIKDHLMLDEETIGLHAINFSSDRFSRDVLIDQGRRNHLYTEWIRNSLSGTMKIATYGNSFCSFKKKEGVVIIDLLSALVKNKGIGGSLVCAVLEYAVRHQVHRVDVVTECGNSAAWRLYLKCGFRITGFIDCFHFVSV